jgi:hypothetical protein
MPVSAFSKASHGVSVGISIWAVRINPFTPTLGVGTQPATWGVERPGFARSGWGVAPTSRLRGCHESIPRTKRNTASPTGPPMLSSGPSRRRYSVVVAGSHRDLGTRARWHAWRAAEVLQPRHRNRIDTPSFSSTCHSGKPKGFSRRSSGSWAWTSPYRITQRSHDAGSPWLLGRGEWARASVSISSWTARDSRSSVTGSGPQRNTEGGQAGLEEAPSRRRSVRLHHRPRVD